MSPCSYNCYYYPPCHRDQHRHHLVATYIYTLLSHWLLALPSGAIKHARETDRRVPGQRTKHVTLVDMLSLESSDVLQCITLSCTSTRNRRVPALRRHGSSSTDCTVLTTTADSDARMTTTCYRVDNLQYCSQPARSETLAHVKYLYSGVPANAIHTNSHTAELACSVRRRVPSLCQYLAHAA